jgi:nitroreductase
MNNIQKSELIRRRRSVRTFDETPLREDDAKKIMDFASMLQNPYDIKIEWKLLSAEKNGLSSPVISGTDAFIAGKMLRVEHAEEAFGYSFEKVVLFAESLGVGTTWIAGTMNRAAFEKAVGLDEGEVMPCVSPLGYAAKKMSLKEIMMRKGIGADKRMDFGELFFDGSFDKPLSPEAAGKLRLPLEMVRLAPSAVNKQPWRVIVEGGKAHFYEKRSKGYLSPDGWDLQKIDLGIALCHFELGAEEAGLKPSFSIEDPGIDSGELVYIASYSVSE